MDDKSENKRDAAAETDGAAEKMPEKRSRVLLFTLIAFMAFLTVKILWLQTVDYQKYRDKVDNQTMVQTDITAVRGKIFDRNGVVLATNDVSYRVFISPRSIDASTQKDGFDYAAIIAKGLSDILGVTEEKILEQAALTRYLDRTLARNVDHDTAQKVRDFCEENAIENMIYLQETATRHYPLGTVASHVLGFTLADGSGAYGLELEYDSMLSGKNGTYTLALDSHGNEIPYLYRDYLDSTDGYSLVTSLDVRVQKALEEQLEAAYLDSGGKKRACGIVMDVRTGAVLGMAVYPFYDPNSPQTLNKQSLEELTAAGFEEQSDEYLSLKQELQLKTWSNKAINEAYIPGSTFKVITASMAYEEALVNAGETFYCPGYYVVNGIKIHCHDTHGHGSLTFAQGLQQSCNPILMMMGQRIGQDSFYRYFKSFGYLEKTGIDLPGEGNSVFYAQDSFTWLNLATSSFGQNFKVTPIQQITAICAVANGGYLVTPYVVEEIVDSDGHSVQKMQPTERRQVISSETSKQIASILEDGVSGNGGAKNAYVAGYRVAAKTGTSEKVDEKDKNGRSGYVCSCVGFAPADDPRVAVLILVDEPTKGSLYGSYVAAPYVARVMETILPYLGVEAVYTQKELNNLDITVPNLVGTSISYAESLAATRGLAVEVIGSGSVVRSQTPDADRTVEKSGGKVILYTEKGAEHPTVTVPDLSGMTALAAKNVLNGMGLNIRIMGTKQYLSGEEPTVVAQSPAGGGQIEVGSIVTVTFKTADDTE